MVHEQRRPGRPEKELAPDTPLNRFAIGLRALKKNAGDPSYRELAQDCGRLGRPYSASTLRNAASGGSAPTVDVTEMFVRACAAAARRNRLVVGNPVEFRDEDLLVKMWIDRWRGLAGTSACGEPVVAVLDGTRNAEPQRQDRAGSRLTMRVAAVTAAAIAVVGGFVAVRANRHVALLRYFGRSGHRTLPGQL